VGFDESLRMELRHIKSGLSCPVLCTLRCSCGCFLRGSLITWRIFLE
jgi:hypothetical protein